MSVLDVGTCFLGLMVGFCVGLTGVGGAALLTPVLVLIGIQPTIAVGTDLFYNAVTKCFGMIRHWRQKTVDWKLVRHFAIGSVPGSIAAVALLAVFGETLQAREQIVETALGCVLVVAALATIAKQLFDRGSDGNKIRNKPFEQKRFMTVALGAALGFIVGLTSIGSGSLFALALIYFYRLNGTQVVGTDIAHAFLLATAAGLMHAGFGHVDYPLAFNLLAGSIPGVWIGSALSAKVPSKPLRTILATIILISGVKMI